MADALLVHIDQHTPRKAYVFKTIFQDLLGLSIHLTEDVEKTVQYDGPKISYGKKSIVPIHFGASALLDEQDIKPQESVLCIDEELAGFFPVNNGVLSFDLFATSFFLLTRYEEYLPHEKDVLGRFPSKNAWLVQHKLIDRPLVDEYVWYLYTLLTKTYPDLPIVRPAYQYIPTYDIDIAYAYKYKGPSRTLAAIAKDTFTGNYSQWKERMSALFGMSQDPFDTYAFQYQLHDQHGLFPVYFFPVGKYGEKDKHNSASHPKIKQLIHQISSRYMVGLHPTYSSNESAVILEKEKKTLEKLVDQHIDKSRQHYLMLSFPETYQRLIQIGIQEDWSMGFPDCPGFRAGTSKPYFWYDLCGNVSTTLKIMPFSVMDATFQHYRDESTEVVRGQINGIIDRLKKVEGTFITNIHNNSLSESNEWKKIYVELIERAVI